MYIKKEDLSYFENLSKSLDEEKRKIFLNIILKAVSKKIGAEVGKVSVVDDSIFDERGVEPQQFITRTMIKKAYKEAKEEK